MMSTEEEEMLDQADLSADIIMSDDNNIYAQYQDGQLHIVEVAPYDRGNNPTYEMAYEAEILPELTSTDSDGEVKYLHLDLLNFAVFKNADGTNTYKMVSSDGTSESGDTVTCVLAANDVDDEGNGHSYVMLETGNEQDPYMYLQSPNSPAQLSPVPNEIKEPEPEPAPSPSADKPKKLTPLQILEKAKAIQKAKALASPYMAKTGRGRKKKGDLPPPIDLLTSPNFKLYLYSCKLCTFKCNAVKEMSAHKKSEHPVLPSYMKGPTRGRMAARFQCAHCPFRAHSRKHLDDHLLSSHRKQKTPACEYITALQLDSEEVDAADVLVCGACGFESGDRPIFKKHIVEAHAAITS